MRATFCLYACQRVVETMIKYKLLHRTVGRDINPRILKLSKFSGDCSRIKYTQVPYGYFLHIRFLLLAYLMFLPLLLMGIPGITWHVIILYLVLISYAYAGLESMSTQILNPFNQDESDHPLDLYCYLNLADTRFVVGKNFSTRSNFVQVYEDKVIPKLKTWLRENIPGFTVTRLKSEKTEALKMVSTFDGADCKLYPVGKKRKNSLNKLSEVVYALYTEEKGEQEER